MTGRDEGEEKGQKEMIGQKKEQTKTLKAGKVETQPLAARNTELLDRHNEM
jgi:hypothetical protein